MKHRILTTAFGLLCASIAFAQQQDFSKVEIKVSKVSGNVYMLEGAGGNIGASVGDDGIVIIDDQYAPLADKIQAALKGIADKPVRFVINTHYHGDHAGGNEQFQKSATVIAHDNVRKRLASGGVLGNGGTMKMDAPASPKGALPIVTFAHDVTVHLNGEDIRALHFPSGHTDGDSIVYFTQSKVVHMGDDFVTYGFPFIDLNGGGNIDGIIAACDNVVAELPADTRVIPGHGPVSTLDDVRKFSTMLKETRATVEMGIKAGKTLEQLKSEKILASWQKFSGPFITTDTFIETLYNQLTGKAGGKYVKHN